MLIKWCKKLVRTTFMLLGLILIFPTFLSVTLAQNFNASHPLDALTPGEVVQAVNLLKAAGHADKSTQYPMVTLYEAPKKVILAWKEGEIGRAHV